MARRAIVTPRHIETWLRDGHGQGHGSQYLPWIKITTRGSPSGGNLQYRYLPELSRYGHLLSAGELAVLRLLLFLGVSDVREQFPCWPWKHPHPLYGHPQFSVSPIPWSSGTLACARDIKIRHPRYPSTSIYYVPTIDILATVSTGTTVRAVAFAVKPDPSDVPLDENDAAKLAISMEYSRQLSIPWRLVSAKRIPAALATNLEVLIHYSGPTRQPVDVERRFNARMTSHLSESIALGETIAHVEQLEQLDRSTSMMLFHRALWYRAIPIDLRQPWLFSTPPALTTNHWIAGVRDYLFGESP